MNDNLLRLVASMVNDRVERERLGYSVDRCLQERVVPCNLRLSLDFKERVRSLQHARSSLAGVKVHYPEREICWVVKFDPDFLRYSMLKYTQLIVDGSFAPRWHQRCASTSVQYFIYMDVSIVEAMYLLPPNSGQVQVPKMCVFHIYNADPRVLHDLSGVRLRYRETSEEGEEKLVFST
jgi:hypothetical protein